MSLTDFFHGVETVTVDAGTRPITTARSSVIGLLYTAPEAKEAAFPYNTPMLFNRRSNYAGMGMAGSGIRSLDAIFDQIGALVVGVRVREGEDEADAFSQYIGGVDPLTGAYTGVQAFRGAESLCGVSPMLFIAPDRTHQRPVGVSGLTVTSQGQNYTTAAVLFSGGNPIIPATAVAVIEGGKITGLRIVRVGVGYVDEPDVTIVGDGTGATVTASLGASSNPVVGEMLGVANDMRAHIIADGPSTTDAAAFAMRADYGSRRVFIVDPFVSGFVADQDSYVMQPPSARIAGLIARVDNEKGFWESPSNKEIFGIGGLARPIDYAFGSKNSRANILNENEIATIKREDGWKLWGNRTCSDDPKFAFLSVSRTTDIVDISIAKAHAWAVDRGITRTYYDDVSGSVTAYFRQLRKQGAVTGGECWVEPEFNTPEDIMAGHATFSYDFSPVYPAERVTFRSTLTSRYLTQIFR